MGTEASSNNTINAGGVTTEVSSSGLEVAIAYADPWWAEGARLLIEQYPVGAIICADDITDSDVIGLPDHPCRLGAVFTTAARDGVIRRVGYHQARRAARAGGVHAVWERA
ncbi:hypothetical protein ACXR2U_04800 [Jatrophihabitans sp. YIM 134969]